MSRPRASHRESAARQDPDVEAGPADDTPERVLEALLPVDPAHDREPAAVGVPVGRADVVEQVARSPAGQRHGRERPGVGLARGAAAQEAPALDRHLVVRGYREHDALDAEERAEGGAEQECRDDRDRGAGAWTRPRLGSLRSGREARSHGLERERNVLGGLEAVLGPLLEAAAHDAVEGR